MVLRMFKNNCHNGFLTALECTKFVFGWGPAGRSYKALLETP